MKIPTKTQWVHMSISHRNGATGYKDGHGWNVIMYWKEKVNHFTTELCKKYQLHQQMHQIKIGQN